MSLIDDVRIMGSGLNRDVRNAITSATISAELNQVTQLELILIDKRWALLESGLFKLNMRVEIDEFSLEISNITTGDEQEVETINIKARPKVFRLFKARRGARVMKNSSPSEFVIAECKAISVPYTVQSSARRTQVTRDVVKKGEKPEVQNPPSTWTTCQRLARELGFLFFEAAGRVYFGKPSWLMQQGGLPSVAANYITGTVDARRTLTVPKCTRTLDDPATTVSVGMLVPSIGYARPGKRLVLTGVPTFNGEYLITKFSADLLDDPNIVDIEAGTPLNPEPNPPQTNSGTTVRTRLGTRLASDFMYWVQKQIGDKYVTGVQVNLASSDPNIFDGSELVQWGAAQVGLFMPDLPNDQIAYIDSHGTITSVASAVATRGAILWRSGHVAISLGGNRAIEDVNGRVGIRGSASSRYTRAGRIPGLLY